MMLPHANSAKGLLVGQRASAYRNPLAEQKHAVVPDAMGEALAGAGVGERGGFLERAADRAASLAVSSYPHAPSGWEIGRADAVETVGKDVGRVAAPARKPLPMTGSSLEPGLRQDMEKQFGHDFSRVRVHTGPEAEASSGVLKARAFTYGNDVVFNQSEFAPHTRSGRHLIAHELAHVIQQGGQPRLIQRTPSAAGEGAALVGEGNPRWRFGRMMDGRGFEMNPDFWRVTYHLTSGTNTRAFVGERGQTALEKVHAFLASHPSWRDGATVDPIEVTIAPGVAASAAAQDLLASGSRSRYSFECFTAAALVQFLGVYRALQSADPATADAIFDGRYADFRVTHVMLGGPGLTMGGSPVTFNLASRPEFSLRQLLDDPADMGLERGDWVFLNNRRFITSGAFQGENATYLGNKRFFGHGIGVFTINEYAQRLRRDHRVTLTVDEILDQVRVGPRYRALASATAPSSAAGSGSGGGSGSGTTP
jgi:hypothetical protein